MRPVSLVPARSCRGWAATSARLIQDVRLCCSFIPSAMVNDESFSSGGWP
jgi:hypothetical protein